MARPRLIGIDRVAGAVGDMGLDLDKSDAARVELHAKGLDGT